MIAGLFLALCCCASAAGSANLTVVITSPQNGGYYIGDTVKFSGVNLVSNKTYVRISTGNQKDDDPKLIFDVVDGKWAGLYTLTDPTRGGQSQIIVKPCSDEEADASPVYPDQAFAEYVGYPVQKPGPTPVPTTIPTTEPTVNYEETIAAIEANVTAHDTDIAEIRDTLAAQISTPTPTLIPEPTPAVQSVPALTVTLSPTPTIDYDAQIAELNKKVAEEKEQVQEQNDPIYQIMKFLGLE